MPSLLFIAPADLGEAVFATAALDHVLSPETRATILCGPGGGALFRGAPGRVTTHEIAGRALGAWFAAVQRVGGTRFDLLLDLSGARIGMGLRAGRRVMRGSARELRHRVEDYAALLGAERLTPRLWLDDRARDAAQAVCAGSFILLAPAASPRARWAGERYAAVARRLAGGGGPLLDTEVIILADSDMDHAIAASLASDGVAARVVAGLDALAVAALAERATLMLGGEGPLLPIAAAAGAPTLALYGPSDERVTGPYGPRTRVLRGRPYEEIVALSAATLDERPLMDELSVDAVEAAALELLRAGGLR